MLDYWLEFDDHDESLTEIDPLEVQRVIAALDELIRTLGDDTIKVYLHAACDDLGNLLASGADEADEESDGENNWAEAA